MDCRVNRSWHSYAQRGRRRQAFTSSRRGRWRRVGISHGVGGLGLGEQRAHRTRPDWPGAALHPPHAYGAGTSRPAPFAPSSIFAGLPQALASPRGENSCSSAAFPASLFLSSSYACIPRARATFASSYSSSGLSASPYISLPANPTLGPWLVSSDSCLSFSDAKAAGQASAKLHHGQQ